MKLNITSLICVAGLITIAFLSCEKSEVGTIKSQLALSIQSDSTTFNIKNSTGKSTTTPPIITFGYGLMNISTFKFDGMMNGKQSEFTTDNASNIDIFSAAPGAFITTLDNGTYTAVLLTVQLSKSATVIPLIIRGTYRSPTGVLTPIEVDYNDDTQIKTKIKDQLVVDGQSDFSSDIKIHLDRLFTGITSANLDAAALTNGVILISSTLNKTLYAKIKANLVNSGGNDGIEIFLED